MAKKGSKATIAYQTSEGKEVKSVQPDVVAIIFNFADDIGKEVVDLAKFPDDVKRTAFVRGIAEKLRDTYAGADNTEEAYDSFSSMLEQLVAGDWRIERESAGPRISLVLQAVIAAWANAGKPLTEDQQKAYADTLKEKSAREDALKHPKVKAEYEGLRAQAAADRAKKAAEAAAAAGADMALPGAAA